MWKFLQTMLKLAKVIFALFLEKLNGKILKWLIVTLSLHQKENNSRQEKSRNHGFCGSIIAQKSSFSVQFKIFSMGLQFIIHFFHICNLMHTFIEWIENFPTSKLVQMIISKWNL